MIGDVRRSGLQPSNSESNHPSRVVSAELGRAGSGRAVTRTNERYNLPEAIDREYKQGDVIVINGEYEGGSSINFYTRKLVYILNGRSANLEYGSYFDDAPRIFIDDEELAKMWTGSVRIFLFTDSSKLDELNRAVRAPVYPVAESGGKLIVTNQQSK